MSRHCSFYFCWSINLDLTLPLIFLAWSCWQQEHASQKRYLRGYDFWKLVHYLRWRHWNACCVQLASRSMSQEAYFWCVSFQISGREVQHATVLPKAHTGRCLANFLLSLCHEIVSLPELSSLETGWAWSTADGWAFCWEWLGPQEHFSRPGVRFFLALATWSECLASKQPITTQASKSQRIFMAHKNNTETSFFSKHWI